jgi:hypothetical protein
MEMQNVEIERVNESNFEDIPGQPPFDCKSCICFEQKTSDREEKGMV